MMRRRTLLGGLAGMAAGATPLGRTQDRSPQALASLDPRKQAHLGLLQKKLIYAADNRPLIWWTRGKKYGSINGEITPLWTLNVIHFKNVTQIDNGSFDVRSMELVYKTDTETDALLHNWRNPYNGEIYEEIPLIMGPLTRRYTDTGPISQSALPGADIKRSGTVGPAEIVGNDVWLWTDAHVLVDRGERGMFRAHDLKIYHGHVSDVLDPNIQSIPATTTAHLIQSWHPWMNMGDREGTLITRLAGTKCFSVEDVHPRIRGLLKKHHPEIAKDFLARLAGPPEQFDR